MSGPWDWDKAPRCGAKTRSGEPCKNAAMKNPHSGKQLRCRMHGGCSSGAKTPEGKAKARQSNLKHGRRSQAYIDDRRERRAEIMGLLADVKATSALIERELRRRKRDIERQRRDAPDTPITVIALQSTKNADE
jgi:hypothetical protein